MNTLVIDKNKIKEIYIDTDTEIKLEDNTKNSITIIVNNNVNLNIEIGYNSTLVCNLLNINKSININIIYNGEFGKILLNNSIINYTNNKITTNIEHCFKNTVSDIVNHGINVLDNELYMDISAHVLNENSGCNLLQDNKIINIGNGRGIIRPNLLIDEYDSSANHSAYISKFRKDELFYLMSRGISYENSIFLLIKSFLINRMKLDNEVEVNFIDNMKNIERGCDVK